MKKNNSTNIPSCHKKTLIALSMVLSCFFMLYCIPYEMLTLPFQKLPPKFELLAYRSYMLLASGCIMIIGLTVMSILLLLFHEKAKETCGKILGKTFYLGIIILFLSAIPSYYLSERVDSSNYVRCLEESSVSIKVSCDVYAESEDLCRSKQ